MKDVINNALTLALERAANEIRMKLQSSGRIASGDTSDSIKVNIKDSGASLTGTVPLSVMDKGRGGGGVPKGFREIIYAWSISKGISFPDEQSRKRFSYLTAKKISTEGDSLFRSGQSLGIKDIIFNDTIRTLGMSIKEALKSSLKGVRG